ncbi:hypothetical protein ABT147_21615 [Streptomyces sp. NPDC001868]|uniref:hypothetical protein n=1 Tax=Streptomyces sp. NPDC001868 TaxID=3154401 RepID=UPI00332D15B3
MSRRAATDSARFGGGVRGLRPRTDPPVHNPPPSRESDPPPSTTRHSHPAHPPTHPEPAAVDTREAATAAPTPLALPPLDTRHHHRPAAIAIAIALMIDAPRPPPDSDQPTANRRTPARTSR